MHVAGKKRAQLCPIMRSEGPETRILQTINAKSCNMTPGGRDGWKSGQQLDQTCVRSCNTVCGLNLSDATSLRVSASKSSFTLKRCSRILRQRVGKCKSKPHPTRLLIPSDGIWSPTIILSTLIHLCHPHSCSPFMSNEKTHDSARCKGLPDGHSEITSLRWIAVILQLPLFSNDMSFSLWLSGWKKKIFNLIPAVTVKIWQWLDDNCSERTAEFNHLKGFFYVE